MSEQLMLKNGDCLSLRHIDGKSRLKLFLCMALCLIKMLQSLCF